MSLPQLRIAYPDNWPEIFDHMRRTVANKRFGPPVDPRIAQANTPWRKQYLEEQARKVEAKAKAKR